MRFNSKKAFGKGKYPFIDTAISTFGLIDVLHAIECVCSDSLNLYPKMVEYRINQLIRERIGHDPADSELGSIEVPVPQNLVGQSQDHLVKLFIYSQSIGLTGIERLIFPDSVDVPCELTADEIKSYFTDGGRPTVSLAGGVYYRGKQQDDVGTSSDLKRALTERHLGPIEHPASPEERFIGEFNRMYEAIPSAFEIDTLNDLIVFSGPYVPRTVSYRHIEGREFELGVIYKIQLGNQRYIGIRGELGGLIFNSDGSVANCHNPDPLKKTLWVDDGFKNTMNEMIFEGFSPGLLVEIADLSVSDFCRAERMLKAHMEIVFSIARAYAGS